MAVAESVRSACKGSGNTLQAGRGGVMRGVKNAPLLKIRTIAFFVCMLPFAASYAQVVADPNAPGNQKPTVVQTANGLPQVNIQTHSAAGVSRNTYRVVPAKNCNYL